MLVSSGPKPVTSIVPAFGRTTLCANTLFLYWLSLSMVLPAWNVSYQSAWPCSGHPSADDHSQAGADNRRVPFEPLRKWG